MPLRMEVGLGSGDAVLDEDPASALKKEAQTRQFSAMSTVDKRLKCIRIPVGMEVGLGAGDIVLDGTQLKRATAPNFRSMSVVAKRLREISMEVGLGSGDFVLDGELGTQLSLKRGTAYLAPQKGGTAPNFRPLSILAKRLDVSGYHLVRR